MSPRPRILIIENSIDVTGALKSITAMALDLSEQYDFYFVLPKNSKAKDWLTPHIKFKVIELPMMEIRRSWRIIFYFPVLLLNAFRLNKIIRENKIDLVHGNDLYNLVATTSKSLEGKFKYVCHIRFMPAGFPKSLFNFWMMRQLKHAEKVIAVSNVLKAALPPSSEILVIHDRILEGKDPDTTINRSGNTILCLSNIIPGKGINHAIEAFAKIHASFPLWKLKIVGGDMGLEKNKVYKQQLIDRTQQLGISEKIEWKNFTGNVSSEYQSADIFVNFSESESFSMTCLESLYNGCPVIATKSGGPAEIIDDAVSGFLVNRGDVNDMAASMKLLIEDATLRKSMGTEGARLVREKFSSAKTSGLLHALYSDILR